MEQGAAQAQSTMRHMRAENDQGVLICTAMDWWQQTTEVIFPLWEQPWVTLNYLEHNWFTEVRRFLAMMDGTLKMSGVRTSLQTANKTNNLNLMKEAARVVTLEADLTKFNRCQIHLGVTWSSEPVTAEERKITRDVCESKPTKTHTATVELPVTTWTETQTGAEIDGRKKIIDSSGRENDGFGVTCIFRHSTNDNSIAVLRLAHGTKTHGPLDGRLKVLFMMCLTRS